MKKLTQYVRLDDAFFVLALAVPFLFSVARYVETSTETSAMILAQQSRKDAVVKASPQTQVEIAQTAVRVR
jgi:hypothetical protein